jgi:Domain of unknown function (DUF4331)
MRLRSPSLAAVACALAACGVHLPVIPEADVYVPAPAEAGADSGEEAGQPDAGGDATFGLGQVDRAGHTLVNVVLVPPVHQDDYNAEPSFETNVPRVLQDAIESRLELLDTIAVGDGGPDPVDWAVPEGGTHPLLPLFLTDVLLVDTSLSCTEADGGFSASYLDIEREIYLQSPPHTTCGGRTPGDDVVTKTLTLLVTGDRDGGPTIGPGASGPTRPATTTFPYLAPPN